MTGALDERPIRVQVDNGSSVTVVWSKLVPNPPEDAPKQTIVSFTGEKNNFACCTLTGEALQQDLSGQCSCL